MDHLIWNIVYVAHQFLTMNPIILASQSPRRKQLLEWAEIPFEVVVSNANEDFSADLSPSAVAEYIAKNKAMAVALANNSDKIILAADTIVVCNSEILGKPTSKAHAIETIKKLSGITHEVITGVAILSSHKELIFHESTFVSFHPISDADIEFYVDKYQPYDKAGAYAIQEWIGVVGIKEIKGDFYNVMGLPISRVAQELKLF
jgi:septum formation protein